MPSHWTKDPAANVDYGVDWTAYLALGSDAIATSTWIVPSGLTKGATQIAGTRTIVWLTGGTVGQTYSVVNEIVTVGGRTDRRTLTIFVQSR